MTVINSWKIHKLANKNNKIQLQFRSHLARILIKREAENKNSDEEEKLAKCRPSKNSLPSGVRWDRIDYLIVEEERKRCRMCKNTNVIFIYYLKKKNNVKFA